MDIEQIRYDMIVYLDFAPKWESWAMLQQLWDEEVHVIESDNDEEVELVKLRQCKRTEKARQALANARAARKEAALQARVEGQLIDDRAGWLQSNYCTRKVYNLSMTGEIDRKKIQKERGRCVYSLLRILVQAIQSMFQPNQAQHVISCVVADDTNVRMAGPTGQNQIFTICDAVQSLHVRTPVTGSQDGAWTSINIPTPALVLSAAKTADIHGAMTAFSIVSGQGIGKMMRSIGLESTPSPVSAFHTEIVVGDALKANDAAWRLERQLLKQRRLDEVDDACSRTLALRVKCMVHQINLIRKPCVLAVPHYWSTLVRLGHMFEQASFRKAIAASLLRVLQESFHRALLALDYILYFFWGGSVLVSGLVVWHVKWTWTMVQ